ncbi:hypothetical protein Drorol1_Dr00024006 [Drosera rotundifolia]
MHGSSFGFAVRVCSWYMHKIDRPSLCEYKAYSSSNHISPDCLMYSFPHALRRFSMVIQCTSPLNSQYDSTVQGAAEVAALPEYHKRILLTPAWCLSSGNHKLIPMKAK